MYNGTWYTGSSSWAQPAGYADGADLGDIIITNGLVLGAEVKSWGEGNAAKHLPVLHYCFDYVKDVHEVWHNDLTIPYDNWDGSANVFKSADVGNADLTGLDAGPHTISLYISKEFDDDNTLLYDSGDDNYTADFTLIKVVDVPAAVTGLVYDGNSQTGVAAGTGYTLSGNAASAAGTYTATATLDQYYQWSDGTTAAKTIEWSIAPAPLTVAANNITIDHGAAAPAYTYTVTGLVEGESLATAPALSCDYAQGDGIGTYAISVTNAVASANYVISYTPGTLTVQSKTYDVTFVDEDGTTVLKAATAYEYGTAADDIVKPDDPTKEATEEYTYAFAGWSPALADVTEDAVYTATYTPAKRSYTITWLNDDDSLIDTTTVAFGAVPTHADATKAETAEWRYTFAGWDPEVVSVTGEATYKATFDAAEKYAVTVADGIENGSVSVDKATAAEGDLVTVTAIPDSGYVLDLIRVNGDKTRAIPS